MRPLPPRGTIGVAAPASPYDSRSEVERGVEWWESRGYKVKLAPHVDDRDDYVAGDAKDRAADLNALFADPEVDVVQALQGGYGSAQAIPYLDFDVIAANPKPLVGFSDITALHVAIGRGAGFPTVYGNGLSVVPSHDPRERTRPQILRGEAPNAVRIPSGCRFHPRCPIAIADCREIDPALEPAGSGSGHTAACILAG